MIRPTAATNARREASIRLRKFSWLNALGGCFHSTPVVPMVQDAASAQAVPLIWYASPCSE